MKNTTGQSKSKVTRAKAWLQFWIQQLRARWPWSSSFNFSVPPFPNLRNEDIVILSSQGCFEDEAGYFLESVYNTHPLAHSKSAEYFIIWCFSWCLTSKTVIKGETLVAVVRGKSKSVLPLNMWYRFGKTPFQLWVFVKEKKKSTNILSIHNSFLSLSQPPEHSSKSQGQIQILALSETHRPGWQWQLWAMQRSWFHGRHGSTSPARHQGTRPHPLMAPVITIYDATTMAPQGLD